ncbi:hypothetical protein PspLS_04612 [Pyricularia sp. CBS 133598]|nr:hypothetical protein PspLS_04612 [Pyricularia sp. CBS 133598]
MTIHEPIHPKLAKKRNKQLRTKLISAGLFTFSAVTRGPTLLRLLVRSRLEPANSPEAHAPDVYSLGIMLLLMDLIGHAGHVGTTFRHPPSDDPWHQEDMSSSSNILLTTNAVAWLSLSVLLAAMAPYANRDLLFWLSVAFQIAAGFIMPASLAIWRHRDGLARLGGRCVASAKRRVRRARKARRERRVEGVAAEEAAIGETAPGEVALGKVASREVTAGREVAAGKAVDREIAAPAPAHVSQPVQVVALAARKADNLPAGWRRKVLAVPGGRARLDGAAGAGGGLDVEVAGAAVALAAAERSTGPELVGGEGEVAGLAAGATVSRAGAVGKSDRDPVEAAGAAELDGRDLGNATLGGQGGNVAEEVAVGAAELVRRAQGRADGPVKVDGDGVVVREQVAIVLQELGAGVAPLLGLEVQGRAGAVEDLVDGLAEVGGAGVAAERLDRGLDAAADQLDPGVGHAVLQTEDGDAVGDASVAAVGVAKDEHGVALAAGLDRVRHLAQVGVAGLHVGLQAASVGVEVVAVDIDALGDAEPHEGVALGGEAVGTRRVLADVPLDTLKVDPVVVGHAVQARAEGDAARGGGAEGVLVGLVDGCVEVEVLLEVDQVVAVLRQLGTDVAAVGCLVARHIVAVEDGRQTGNVHGENVEGAAGGLRNSAADRRQCHCGHGPAGDSEPHFQEF